MHPTTAKRRNPRCKILEKADAPEFPVLVRPASDVINPGDISMKVNDKAPDFTLQDENGNEVALKDLRGKTVILFFYPRASTPG
jgi:AhpC/TSA family